MGPVLLEGFEDGEGEAEFVDVEPLGEVVLEELFVAEGVNAKGRLLGNAGQGNS